MVVNKGAGPKHQDNVMMEYGATTSRATIETLDVILDEVKEKHGVDTTHIDVLSLDELTFRAWN